jgi:hypothetical protein
MGSMLEIFNHISIWQTLFSFGFFSVLLLLFLVYNRIHWVIKTVITLFCLVTFFLAYSTLNDSFGWPYRHSLPGMFKFSWIEVREPHEKDPGSIRIWLHEYNAANKIVDPRPRSYEIPYTKEGQKKAAQVQKRLKQGQETYGKKGKGKDGADGNGSNGFDVQKDGQGSGEGHGAGRSNHDGRRGIWGKILEGWLWIPDGDDSYGGGYELIDPPKDELPPKNEQAPGGAPEEHDQAPETEGSHI